jgi:glycosyltransferase involved in cell wall biosynthesis
LKILLLDAQDLRGSRGSKIAASLGKRFEIDVLAVQLHSSSIFRGGMKCLAITILAIPRIFEYDCVFATSSLMGAPLSVFCKIFGFKRPRIVVIDIGAARLLGSRDSLLENLAKWSFTSVDLAVCHSKEQRRRLEVDIFPRAEFIHLGVDLNDYEVEVNPKGNYILCVGRTGRDYPTLFRAARQLKDRFIVVIGDDPLPVISEHQAGVKPENVTLLKEVEYEEYLGLMKEASLIVLPLCETAAPTGQTVLLEAMAMGKAIVVSKVASVIDYVDDGKDVILVRPGDSDDLAGAIRRLMMDDEELQALGINARHAAVKSMGFERMMDEVSLEIERVIDGSK